MLLSDYRGKVARLIQDESGRLSDAEMEGFIIDALSYYSKDAPLHKTADIAGDGGYQYDLPADWFDDFSSLLSVEYPAGRQIPLILAPEDYSVYKTPGGVKLHFYNFSPQVGENIRINYLTFYGEDQLGFIPLSDQEVFCVLAAALCCEALARNYAQTSEALLDADSVDYRSKSDDYARRASELFARYRNFMGKKEDSPQAAGQTQDWDASFSWGGDFLVHGKRFR